MRANCWMGPRYMQVEDVPDPKILNERGGKKTVVRFDLGTPLVRLQQFRNTLIEKRDAQRTSGKASLSRDAARYLKRKRFANPSSVRAELRASLPWEPQSERPRLRLPRRRDPREGRPGTVRTTNAEPR